MQKINLIGKRFGKLLVIKEVEQIKKRRHWLCKCDCGNEKIIHQGALTRPDKPTRSCGCLAKEYRLQKIKRKTKAITYCITCGKKISFLSQQPPKNCSMECKKIYNRKRDIEYNHKSLDNKLIGQIASIKSKCKKKNIEFDINKIYILNKIKEQNNRCIKTGIFFEISEYKKEWWRSPWSASIDRIDPNKGYTKDNIQIVCFMYNLAKNIWSDNEVLEFCQKVTEIKSKRL